MENRDRSMSVDTTIRSILQQIPAVAAQMQPTALKRTESSPPQLQKRPSKTKLPPFTRGENPSCPSPAPAGSPAVMKSTTSPRNSATHLHAGSCGVVDSFPGQTLTTTSKNGGADTSSINNSRSSATGTVAANRPHPLPPLADTTAVIPGMPGSPRPRSSSQDSPTGRFPPAPHSPHSLTRRSSQPGSGSSTGSFGIANSMSIETGVLSPRRISIPSATSTSPSPPPPHSPQPAWPSSSATTTSTTSAYRPGSSAPSSSQMAGRNMAVGSAASAGRSSTSSADGDATFSSPSPTGGTAFQYSALKSAFTTNNDSSSNVLPSAVPTSSSPTRPASASPQHYATAPRKRRTQPDGRPAYSRANSETAVKKIGSKESSGDPEQELQEQLAKLGESLNKLKSFSRSNSMNKSRSDLPKDYKTQTGRTAAAAAMGSTDVMAAKPAASRPRRLTRTASDGDSLRYDFDLRPESTSQSPLALEESEEDAFDTFPDEATEKVKKRTSAKSRSRAQQPVRKEVVVASKSVAPAAKAKGIHRAMTFSHGNESALRRKVYGSSGADDHHAIAALPPDLLLKRILFDKSSAGSSPASPPTVKS